MVVDASEGVGSCSLGKGEGGIQASASGLDLWKLLSICTNCCMLTVSPATVFSLLCHLSLLVNAV